MAKPKDIQLEVAAHWLEEVAAELAALNRQDLSQICKRVSRECKASAEATGEDGK